MPSKYQVTQRSGGEKRGAVSQSRKPASRAPLVGVLRYTFEFHLKKKKQSVILIPALTSPHPGPNFFKQRNGTAMWSLNWTGSGATRFPILSSCLPGAASGIPIQGQSGFHPPLRLHCTCAVWVLAQRQGTVPNKCNRLTLKASCRLEVGYQAKPRGRAVGSPRALIAGLPVAGALSPGCHLWPWTNY